MRASEADHYTVGATAIGCRSLSRSCVGGSHVGTLNLLSCPEA